MACMLLLAACDNYLDIQPTGSVIPNSLAESAGTTLLPMPIPHRLNGPSITMCFLLPITLLRAEVILRKALRKR